MEKHDILPGLPYPLGATYDGKGTNFALFSAGADMVELCLFDKAYGEQEIRKVVLNRRNDIWHVYVPEAGPGQHYGYRVHGPFDPKNGFRFNAHKVLLDPYAKAVSGKFRWHPSLFGYPLRSRDKDLAFDRKDSAAHVPKGIVVDGRFDWKGDSGSFVPANQMVIYELHVKGFSKLNEKIPKELRGTYAGLAHAASIAHLKSLGITTVELLPVHQFASDEHLEQKGLSNYWGYNPLGFFAPHEGYSADRSAGAQVREFKQMVRALHQAGFEVILDVVFNHTAEGSHLGPSLSFRGIDNQRYYRLEKDSRYYTDFTGTGNTLDTTSRQVVQLVMDSLRYWVQEMHVDGFRFDLAATLARSPRGINHECTLFQVIHQDPVLSQVKLIAEPWDLGRNGYQLGKFAKPWSEWNGRFRDVVREFWNLGKANSKVLANCLLGSPDIYRISGRRPHAAVNFISAHDGFTLMDLVSYAKKHNLANGESNADGEENNRSTNCSVEGPAVDPAVNALRKNLKRSFLMTLLFSQGIPMLTAGDELGKTQLGNNNAYCQDNELSYLDWEKLDTELFAFTARLIAIRKKYALFSCANWLEDERGIKVKWYSAAGKVLDVDRGRAMRTNVVAVEFGCEERLYLALNAAKIPTVFKLPKGTWKRMIASWPLGKQVQSGSLLLPAKAAVLLVAAG